MSNTIPRIFISHAGADTGFAERLANDLRARGADVWLDASHLGAGDFLSAINQALSQRDVLILVLSPTALQSQWVPLEVHAAIVRSRQGFMQAPVIVVAKAVPLHDIPPLWSPFNHIDATADYALALQRILRVLGLTTEMSTPVSPARPLIADATSRVAGPPTVPPVAAPDAEGSVPSIGFNMKALQQMQNKMMKMQEELQNSTFEGASGGGVVTVTMTGKFEVTAVRFDEEVVDPDDIGLLEDLILTACQDAFNKVAEAQAKLVSSLTGDMKLPPGFGF